MHGSVSWDMSAWGNSPWTWTMIAVVVGFVAYMIRQRRARKR